METIEERAWSCANKKGVTENGRRCIALGYECGASEQADHDIELFERFLDKYHMLSSSNYARAWNKLKSEIKGQ